MPDVEPPVLIEDTAPPGHVEAVEEAFRRAGFEVEVAPEYGRKAADVLPWVVHVTLAAPIAAFFLAFGAEAGKDAYGAVKEWVREVWKAREGAGTGEGSLVLRDSEASSLILSNAIPDEALDALRDIDWNKKRGDYLVWDHDRREWRDPTERN